MEDCTMSKTPKTKEKVKEPIPQEKVRLTEMLAQCDESIENIDKILTQHQTLLEIINASERKAELSDDFVKEMQKQIDGLKKQRANIIAKQQRIESLLPKLTNEGLKFFRDVVSVLFDNI